VFFVRVVVDVRTASLGSNLNLVVALKAIFYVHVLYCLYNDLHECTAQTPATAADATLHVVILDGGGRSSGC
jgi:hypothetical protein